jgi:serine/threonine-protein kinase
MENIGKYQVIEKLGAGGMGVVYRALDTVLQRDVAIKVLSLQLSTHEESRERFFREAHLMGALTHENIVSIYDMGEHGESIYISMEYLEGEDLATMLERREKMSLGTKIRIIHDVSLGLAYAHRKGVIHRDIKPHNIFILSSGQSKILDFGVARIPSSSLTKSGKIVGTANYMAPELLLGDRPDARADIFSLGAVFYELLTYKRAFTGPTLAETLSAIAYRDPEPMKSLDKTIPNELCRIVGKTLVKKASERYQSMEELSRELGRIHTDLELIRRALRDNRRKTVEETATPQRSKERATTLKTDGLPKDADALFRKAAEQFSKGELGGCLFMLGETLRIHPDHLAASILEESLRDELTRLVKQNEQRRQKVIAAVLRSLGGADADAPEEKPQRKDPALIAELRDFLLSTLE